jgi:hypothetical protein
VHHRAENVFAQDAQQLAGVCALCGRRFAEYRFEFRTRAFPARTAVGSAFEVLDEGVDYCVSKGAHFARAELDSVSPHSDKLPSRGAAGGDTLKFRGVPMLSARLIRMISDHWEQIADRVLRQVRRDSKLLELGKLPEPEQRERAREILQSLGRWLVSREEDLDQRSEALGRRRFEEGIPLHEVVYSLQLLRENMIQWVRDQGLVETPLELYAEEELERGSGRIFDTIIYYFVRGYERAMREQWASAAKARASTRVH